MNQTEHAKADYAKPELTVFGSVRNLTGGSGGSVTADSTSMDML